MDTHTTTQNHATDTGTDIKTADSAGTLTAATTPGVAGAAGRSSP